MKLSQVLQAKNPLTGQSTSLLDIQSIFSMILGVVLFLFVVATGQNVARGISGKFGKVDTSPEPLFNTPAASAAGDTIL